MNTNFTRILGVAAVAAGLTFAQTPAPHSGPRSRQQGQWRGHMARHMGQRMATYLNLTDAQKEQSKQIFQAAADQAKPLRQQMQDARKELANAVKSNAPAAQIEQLSNTVGNLTAQLTAIHTKALAQFYSTLTPDQKTKFDTGKRSLRQRRHAPAFRGRGMRRAPQANQ